MFNFTLHSFGLDISDFSMKLVELKRSGSKSTLQAWNKINVPEGLIQKGEIKNTSSVLKLISKLLKSSHGRLSTRYVTASLPETKTFIKVIELPFGSEDILKAVKEELPHHIPLPSEELYFDWEILSSPQEGSRKVLIGAAPKTIVSSYTEILKKAGLTPTALEIEAQAITRALIKPQASLSKEKQSTSSLFKKRSKSLTFSRKIFTKLPWVARYSKKVRDKSKEKSGNLKEKAKVILDLGASRASLILYDLGTIQFVTSLPISGEKITQEIALRFKLKKEEAEKAKIICGLHPKKCKGALRSILEATLSDLVSEIKKALLFYETHFSEGNEVKEIILCGGGANLLNIENFLSKKLNLSTLKGDPLMNLNKNFPKTLEIPKREILSFTTAIGLALRDV